MRRSTFGAPMKCVRPGRGAFLFAGAAAALLSVAGSSLASGEPKIGPAVKLDPRLTAAELPSWAVVDAGRNADDPTLGVYVLFKPHAALGQNAIAKLRAANGVVVNELRSVHGVVAHLPKSRLAQLAAMPDIEWIEAPLPLMSTMNFENRIRTQVNLVADAPYNLDGTGVTALVYDGGIPRLTHLDLVGRVTVVGTGGLSAHSTHVAGTLGGSGMGTVSRFYKGMAPNVRLLSAALQASGGGLPLYNNPADLEADYSVAINTHNADIANNSVGTNVASNNQPCSLEGNYGITDAIIDNVVRGSLGRPLIVVWAAGNERDSGRCGTGYATIPPPAGSKNPICVGAVNSNDDSMTAFSSWGPTDDGRLKPDVVAPGCQTGAGDLGVTSCSAASDVFYEALCGTSMACPTVSGLAALIVQDYRAQFPQAGRPTNAFVKALLIHGAQDLLTPGPDFQTGYGSVRVKRSVDVMRAETFATAEVATGQVREFNTQVQARESSLKATLVWDDPAAGFNPARALINDLDLIVTDPLGRRWYPWTLNPANPGAGAVQTTVDRINNVEQVFVADPIPGVWTIEVAGIAVPGGGGPQGFSVVWSRQACPCDWNDGGGVSSQDFFDFLGAFFTGDADFNASGSTTPEDLFDFLACFMAGCA